MKRLWKSVLLASVLLVPLQATAGAAARTGDTYLRSVDPLTKSFARTTIKWRGKLNGETMIVYGVEEHQGRIAVCGLHLSRGSYSRPALLNGLKVSSISSGGHILITDLRYFDEFAGRRGVLRFACRVTKFRWAPVFARTRPKYVQGAQLFDPLKQ